MASESASTTTGAGSTSAPTIREIIPTNRTPEVWKDFNMCIMTNGQKKDQCKRSRIRIRKSEATSMERWANFHGSIRLSSRTIRGVGDFNGVPFNTLTRADNEGVPKSLWQPRYHHVGLLPTFSIAALNPCFNVSGVDFLIENISRDLEFEDDGFATRSLDWFHESFQGLYNMYYTKYGTNQTQSTSGGGSSSGVSRDPYARLLHGLNQHKKKKSRGDPTMSSEYEQYLKTDFVSGLQPKDFASYDVLGFWKSKENQFPVLSRMAMDILSVQASSVASESAFSTSGRLLTIRRTRLTPESLEMCMCLKDHLDAHERKQNSSPLELPLDVEEGVFNDEVQQNEATQLTDQEIALDASSDGSLSSGEQRRDYMMSSGAEDDQTGEGGSMSHGYTYY
ncbi:zinc finger BED domain-containing protein RICESLEEPER 2-like protein [Tanacetum coccineum]